MALEGVSDMVFGILKDIKEGENRVVATPIEAAVIAGDGHRVLAQRGCGLGSGFSDEKYAAAGAELVDSMEEMYRRCDMLAKVKEIEPVEFDLLREGQIVMTCIHPALHPAETDALLAKKVIAFTAEDCHRYGSPNAEAAGKQGALFGLESLLTINGGKGKFVSGLAGSPGINVVILGAGMAGRAALQVLHSLGARVTVLDVNYAALRDVGSRYSGQVHTMMCTKETIASLLPSTDLIINAVKWPKERKDFLVDKEMLKLMEPGSVLVDISNDEPGAIESSRATTHEHPRYVVNGVVHYCVSNIPGAIAQSTSIAYSAEMLPYIRSILNDGVVEACVKDGYVRRSLTAYKGILTHEETSAIQGKPWARPEKVLGIEGRKLDPAPPATTTRSTNYLP
jgi:alanine dehydrogenase